MCFYKYVVDLYFKDDGHYKSEKHKGLVYAESYAEAVEKIESYYADELASIYVYASDSEMVFDFEFNDVIDKED